MVEWYIYNDLLCFKVHDDWLIPINRIVIIEGIRDLYITTNILSLYGQWIAANWLHQYLRIKPINRWNPSTLDVVIHPTVHLMKFFHYNIINLSPIKCNWPPFHCHNLGGELCCSKHTEVHYVYPPVGVNHYYTVVFESKDVGSELPNFR